MEIAYYHVGIPQRADFLRLMQQVHQVRGRAGAVYWQLYSDVAHPEHWLEVWSMESWTEHLREVVRLSEDDRRMLADVAVFQHEAERPTRYLAVDPNEHLATAMVEREHLRIAGAGGISGAGGIAGAGAGAH
jgi:Transmembrane secretion effector